MGAGSLGHIRSEWVRLRSEWGSSAHMLPKEESCSIFVAHSCSRTWDILLFPGWAFPPVHLRLSETLIWGWCWCPAVCRRPSNSEGPRTGVLDWTQCPLAGHTSRKLGGIEHQQLWKLLMLCSTKFSREGKPFMGINLHDFENLSMTTNIYTLVLGRSVMKLMDRSDQGLWGIGSGCRRPAGSSLGVLNCAHTRQALKKQWHHKWERATRMSYVLSWWFCGY